MSHNSQPIFIHSLFRAGSTYIFNVFRRSDSKYFCYQEPLNEWLLNAAIDPEKLLEAHEELTTQLRHPDLDKPYFYEFYLLAEAVGRLFRKGFSYDQYFSPTVEDNLALKTYFTALVEGAQGRPVFQCCRSAGRVAKLKPECPDAKHIFLWRNPWDQWWSYKLGFDTNNLLIANATNPPEFIQSIKEKLQIPEFHDADTFKEYTFFSSHWLDAAGSYMLFYALWFHAMIEALPHCDLSVSIDRLSHSNAYRTETLAKLGHLGIHGLDFHDCSVPAGVYGKSDLIFFSEIEDRVHGLLLYHGYRQHQLDRVIALRQEYADSTGASVAAVPVAVRDAERARSLARKYETELALSHRQTLRAENEFTISCQETESRLLMAEAKAIDAEAKAIDAGAKAIDAEAKCKRYEMSIVSIEAKVLEAEKRAKELEARAFRAEVEIANSQAKAQKAEAQIQVILESFSWRITAPLRFIASPFISYLGKNHNLLNKLLRVFIDTIKIVPGAMFTAKYCERRWSKPWSKLMRIIAPATPSPQNSVGELKITRSVATSVAGSDLLSSLEVDKVAVQRFRNQLEHELSRR